MLSRRVCFVRHFANKIGDTAAPGPLAPTQARGAKCQRRAGFSVCPEGMDENRNKPSQGNMEYDILVINAPYPHSVN